MTQSNIAVIGWTSAYLSNYPTVPLTEERKQALIDRIRKRKYNFTHQAHQTLLYTAPFYSDTTVCVLTKTEWDEVMNEAYKNENLGLRLMPEDILDNSPVNEVLFEKDKFKKQFLDDIDTSKAGEGDG